jgi:hypothetical protein
MTFWRELSRRNVYRVGVTYLIVAWLLIQVVIALTEPLKLPPSLDTTVIVLLGIGFPITLIIA